MRFVRDDGGREAAGFKGSTGDCGVRAAAIATGVPYREVYDALYELQASSASAMRKLRKRYGENAERYISPRTGVYREVLDKFLNRHGFVWATCMQIGSGCTCHLAEDELPSGALVVRVSKHFTAVLDGVIHDTYDPSRDGTRCVYGYWMA